MKMPNMNDYITLTMEVYIKEGIKLNILSPSEVVVKEKTANYIIIESSMGIAEISDKGTISLMNTSKEIRINKGETKKLTLPVTDYFGSATIKY